MVEPDGFWLSHFASCTPGSGRGRPYDGVVRIVLLVLGAILVLLGLGLAFTIFGLLSILLGVVAISVGIVMLGRLPAGRGTTD